MGYTLLANAQTNISDNTTFQTFGTTISYALANAGLTKVSLSDTINWSTVARPGTTSTAAGYELWQFADALQNTAPVTILFTYGTSSAVTYPQLNWRVSSGYYGNTSLLPGNTVTGFPAGFGAGVAAMGILNQPNAFANNTLRFNFCGDTSRIVMSWGAYGTGSSASIRWYWSIERTKDANGADTADGVLLTWTNSSAWGQMVWSPVYGQIGGFDAYEASIGAIIPAVGGGTRGSNTSVYPIFHSKAGGAFLNPGMNLLAYYHSDFTVNTTTTVSMYGSSHTYMPLGNTAIYAGTSPRTNNSIAYLMRWE